MADPPGIPLFSYGNLRNEDVQMAAFGRLLRGAPDALAGYVCVQIEIKADAAAVSGREFRPIVVQTGNPADVVRGTVFVLSDVELAAADGYEASDCKRIEVTLASGRRAWVHAM